MHFQDDTLPLPDSVGTDRVARGRSRSPRVHDPLEYKDNDALSEVYGSRTASLSASKGRGDGAFSTRSDVADVHDPFARHRSLGPEHHKSPERRSRHQFLTPQAIEEKFGLTKEGTAGVEGAVGCIGSG